MTNPTNTDLATTLREIADTLPLGSALVVRLAADRLSEGDGWVSIQDTWSIPRGTKVEIRWGFNGPFAYRIVK